LRICAVVRDVAKKPTARIVGNRQAGQMIDDLMLVWPLFLISDGRYKMKKEGAVGGSCSGLEKKNAGPLLADSTFRGYSSAQKGSEQQE
jgi:hypothetical protein